MDRLDERFLIYSALAVLCATAAVFLGPAAGFWSFIQIVAMIELVYWFVTSVGKSLARGR
jgi:hypothetical protein